jgi:hypothetical protein
VRAYMTAILTVTTMFTGMNSPAEACTRAVYRSISPDLVPH